MLLSRLINNNIRKIRTCTDIEIPNVKFALRKHKNLTKSVTLNTRATYACRNLQDQDRRNFDQSRVLVC